MDPIDLRSDTVTKPTPEMRQVMYKAEVGDDAFHEDPTVNRLEAKLAAMLGKEAALFVPSGTMGNLIGLLVNAGPATEVIVEARSHIFSSESGGASTLGGIQLRTIEAPRGVLSGQQIEAAVRSPADDHQPTTAAVSLENTHNRCGGSVWTLAELAAASGAAARHGLPVHLDGARIFNAAVATGVPVDEIASTADTVCVCLSKGLGCPVGSLLVGPQSKIERGRRWRTMLGGGMRQAGVLAAAGIFALDTMVVRLAEDHTNAQQLARGLRDIDSLECDPAATDTNIVIATVRSGTARNFVVDCAKGGLLALAIGPSSVRFVTHVGVTASDIDRAVNVAYRVIQSR
jgi:threonine aldolase